MASHIIEHALSLLSEGQPQPAAEALASYCSSNPLDSQGWFLLGAAFHKSGQLIEALDALDRAISIDPRSIQARCAKGAVWSDLGNHREAQRVFQKALHLAPGDPQLLVNLGVVLEQTGDNRAALERYEQALELHPDFSAALLNRGALLMKLGCLGESLENNRYLTERFSDWELAWYNLGEVFLALGRWEEALSAYDQALAIKTDSAKLYFAKGLALSLLRRFVEAQLAFNQAKFIDSTVVEQCIHNVASLQGGAVKELSSKVIYLLKESQHLESCNWTCWETLVSDFEKLIDGSHGQADELCERALIYHALCLPISVARRLNLARSVSAHIIELIRAEKRPVFVHGSHNRQKLRIGYVSPDFGFHPVGRLTRQLYGFHDRSLFEVFGYSLQPSDGSVIRREIECASDHFVDLEKMTDHEAATQIHADQIDILIDLAGYTTHSRTEIFAFRPAPVQVSYNGFPGSMGASFIDYFITDDVCSPPGQESQFTEKLVYLPGSCMIYNNREEVSTCVMSRAEFGLPEKGFVYCCFNNGYKIEPNVFEIWIRILKRVPDSVLWLFGKSDDMIANLRKEAERRGVSGSRLVFAAFLPRIDEHLARYRLADLFLDTLYFNAGTTAADALWAGLPVLSCPGSTFISRWASSMLKAVGLDEMVVESLEQYEERACYLARNPDELAGIKHRLDINRLTKPLFDTERYVRHLETAYQTMWYKHEIGQPPASFHVVD